MGICRLLLVESLKESSNHSSVAMPLRAELEDLLLYRYAPIFRSLHRRVWDGVPGSAFECGDGWFHIIDCLCCEILLYVTNDEMSAGTGDAREGKTRHIALSVPRR